MKDMIDYCVYAKPEQYESVMAIFYDMKIFPMEEDPIDLEDYIKNFNFSEECNGLLKFYLWCTADSNIDSIKLKFKQAAGYDASMNLPRLELDDE